MSSAWKIFWTPSRRSKKTRKGRSEFDADERTQVWVVYHLEILGEAANNLSTEVREAHPEIPWAKMIGMRNILAHRYFGIDRDIVWQVVERDLPEIKPAVERVYRKMVGGI